MLLFWEDKLLVRPYATLLAGVERFLELASPDSREPLDVVVSAGLSSFRWNNRPGGPSDARGEKMNAAAAMDALRELAPKRWAECSARWSPRFGPDDLWARAPFATSPYMPNDDEMKANVLPNFLLLNAAPNNPDPRTVWGIFYLALPFTGVDADFLAWLERANACLPFKLGRSKWRVARPGRKGQLVIRKPDWTGAPE